VDTRNEVAPLIVRAIEACALFSLSMLRLTFLTLVGGVTKKEQRHALQDG